MSAAYFSALLLLALAGGFLFAVRYEGTRFDSQRGGGQRLYFYAAVSAVLLLILSRLLLVAAHLIVLGVEEYTSWDLIKRLSAIWNFIAGPFAAPDLSSDGLPTFLLAFALGWLMAPLANKRVDYVYQVAKTRDRYGSQLEQFLDDASVEAELIYVALANGKVYVGFPLTVPMPKLQGNEVREYFSLWPQFSGYVDDKQRPQFTVQYSSTYQKIMDGSITQVDLEDFTILIPLDDVVVVRIYSLEIDQNEFQLKRGLRWFG